jgi:hypothetical protein
MPFAIHSSKPGKHGRTGITHTFFGETEEEAWESLEEHADICPKFGAAYHGSETIESAVEIDEIPDFDVDAIDDFFDVDRDDEEDGG